MTERDKKFQAPTPPSFTEGLAIKLLLNLEDYLINRQVKKQYKNSYNSSVLSNRRIFIGGSILGVSGLAFTYLAIKNGLSAPQKDPKLIDLSQLQSSLTVGEEVSLTDTLRPGEATSFFNSTGFGGILLNDVGGLVLQTKPSYLQELILDPEINSGSVPIFLGGIGLVDSSFANEDDLQASRFYLYQMSIKRENINSFFSQRSKNGNTIPHFFEPVPVLDRIKEIYKDQPNINHNAALSFDLSIQWAKTINKGTSMLSNTPAKDVFSMQEYQRIIDRLPIRVVSIDPTLIQKALRSNPSL